MHEITVAALWEPAVGTRFNVSRKAHECGALHVVSLGNPFPVRGGERGSVIAPYRRWLWSRIEARDEAVVTDLHELLDWARAEPITLSCWCAQPGPCHAHVVASALRWMDSL